MEAALAKTVQSPKVRKSVVLGGSTDPTHVEESTGDMARGRTDRLAWQAFQRGRRLTGEGCGISVCVCSAQDPSGHQAVLGMAFFTFAAFVVLYVLVYVECLVSRWLRASALLIWVCLMMLGYMLVFDSWMNTTSVRAQVMGPGTLASPGGLGATSQWCTWQILPSLGIRSLLETGPVSGVLALGLPPPTGCGSTTEGGCQADLVHSDL